MININNHDVYASSINSKFISDINKKAFNYFMNNFINFVEITELGSISKYYSYRHIRSDSYYNCNYKINIMHVKCKNNNNYVYIYVNMTKNSLEIRINNDFFNTNIDPIFLKYDYCNEKTGEIYFKNGAPTMEIKEFYKKLNDHFDQIINYDIIENIL